ncbi:hypothetical protein LDJ79_04490 [Vibrio tritonius]|uniref:Uncharacterized protein n=1 Tax=Vibrio tritonius TaxID=1435069 RepID=A0ABS7YJ25_9VIBR|nr:hypothetical protein [Vibrio tritonius]MCA2015358.1 hypothetical protein [Vibrio tritonius]
MTVSVEPECRLSYHINKLARKNIDRAEGKDWSHFIATSELLPSNGFRLAEIRLK